MRKEKKGIKLCEVHECIIKYLYMVTLCYIRNETDNFSHEMHNFNGAICHLIFSSWSGPVSPRHAFAVLSHVSALPSSLLQPEAGGVLLVALV